MRKVNFVNLVKLMAMGICIVILLKDFVNIFGGVISGVSVGLTWYGVIVDTMLLILGSMIYEDLFGE
jgi:hypothetical protein